MFNANTVEKYVELKEPLKLGEFFEGNGYKVLSSEVTKGGSNSRCLRVTIVSTESENLTPIVLHIKWIERAQKALKSKYEPIVSKILLEANIPTSEVLLYLPEGILTDGTNAHACVISKYFEPDNDSIVQLNDLKDQLTSEQRKSVTLSLADLISRMHSIQQDVLNENHLDRITDKEKAIQLIIDAYNEGFFSEEEKNYILQTFELISTDLHLVHKDAYTENLLVDTNNPSEITAVVDLEHAEQSGIGQDFYALTLFYFPRIGEEYREIYIQEYLSKTGISRAEFNRQIITFGMARACEVFLQGKRINFELLITFANQFKTKELNINNEA